MLYRRLNSLLLLFVAPTALACGVAIEEDDNVVWLTEVSIRHGDRPKYYAAVFDDPDFQLRASGDLATGRPLGQDHEKRSELPNAHGVLYLLASARSIDELADYQVAVRKPDASIKGAGPYGKELTSSFSTFRETSSGADGCRWQW